jgi:hypothetical protein
MRLDDFDIFDAAAISMLVLDAYEVGVFVDHRRVVGMSPSRQFVLKVVDLFPHELIQLLKQP